MKKVLSVLLVLALLIPMCAVLPISGAGVEVEPFYFVNWQDDFIDFENIYKMPKFNCGTITDATTSAPITFSVEYRTKNTIPDIASALKEVFDEYPEGARYINFPLNIHVLAEDRVYLDKGTDLFSAWIDEFFADYKRIGGEIDGLAVDVEYHDGGAYYIDLYRKSTTADGYGEEYRTAHPEIWNDIVADERYATEIRPLLAERGYEFEGEPEISTMVTNKTNYAIWNAVNTNRLCAYINEAVAPLYTYYPEALVSNYEYSSNKAWDGSISESGGTTIGGNTDYAGNVANSNFYLRRPYDGAFYPTSSTKGYIKPDSYNGAAYERTVFNSFLFETMTFKNMYDAADNHQLSAWIAGYNYDTKGNSKLAEYIGETPYYTETLFHIGLLNPQPFIGYVLQRDTTYEHYDDAMQIISETLDELTRLVGAADRQPIPVSNYWNSAYVLSGMYAGGRNVWRLTPDTAKVSLADFKVEGKAPTFKVDGQTIIFPQGRVIETDDIHLIGSCGYWIETPADVKPVVINDADRYSQNPSYEENFETYAVDTEFNGTTARNVHAWTVDGNALTVVENAGDKALAMTGTSTLTLTKLPANITAGDSYAMQQVWEVTVTAPSGGSLNLLSAGDADGFVMENGKVAYLNAGNYQELATVSAGSTYTLRREVDFTNNVTKYSVYADGALLAGTENVAMSGVTAPVQTITFAATGVTGTAYIDDYKMYPTGVTTELKVYDAKTGIEADPNDTRTSDTGYRLSWMNASDTDKVVKLYNGSTLVAEAHMAPGADGVLKGVVKGTSVKLTATVEDADPIEYPDYNAGDFNWVGDATAPRISVETVTAAAGQTVEVDVSLANNPGIVAATLQVKYDTEVLTLTEVKDLGNLGTAMHKQELESPYTLSWANGTVEENFTYNGAVATLVFEVAADAAFGDYSIEITYDYDNDDIINADLETVNFLITNGFVTVGEAVVDIVVGDVNDDGKINSLDELALAKRVAGLDGATVNEAAADVNADGKINSLDELVLAKHVAGLDGYETLPVK